MHKAMCEKFKCLRFDILDHSADPERTNFMDLNSVSGFA